MQKVGHVHSLSGHCTTQPSADIRHSPAFVHSLLMGGWRREPAGIKVFFYFEEGLEG